MCFKDFKLMRPHYGVCVHTCMCVLLLSRLTQAGVWGCTVETSFWMVWQNSRRCLENRNFPNAGRLQPGLWGNRVLM